MVLSQNPLAFCALWPTSHTFSTSYFPCISSSNLFTQNCYGNIEMELHMDEMYLGWKMHLNRIRARRAWDWTRDSTSWRGHKQPRNFTSTPLLPCIHSPSLSFCDKTNRWLGYWCGCEVEHASATGSTKTPRTIHLKAGCSLNNFVAAAINTGNAVWANPISLNMKCITKRLKATSSTLFLSIWCTPILAPCLITAINSISYVAYLVYDPMDFM